jgi:hypothetical protein
MPSSSRACAPSAGDVDCHQFLVLTLIVGLQLRTFQLEVGLFGVCL